MSEESERKMFIFKCNHEWQLKMFESVIASGQGATRTALLINGGATAAMLAFVARLIIGNKDGQLLVLIKQSVFPLACYAWGLGFAAVLAGLVYVNQVVFEMEQNKRIIINTKQLDAPGNSFGYPKQPFGKTIQWISVFLWIASMGMFFYGTYSAYEAFCAFTVK